MFFNIKTFSHLFLGKLYTEIQDPSKLNILIQHLISLLFAVVFLFD